jgi:hypothetical protein
MPEPPYDQVGEIANVPEITERELTGERKERILTILKAKRNRQREPLSFAKLEEAQ